ncbi:hypothetical protein [Spirosoma oryzicola]|uniref:hypothetical protein n=1 Tax=Spirosoma oryzicola TaxID=2898794 RepID=UPI001E2E1EB9|nr:hypothetical protein [Spirosoma oryzicola]UHG89317.1 hypothetical protein LQ777_13795 [Spirosoma oryzicola]
MSFTTIQIRYQTARSLPAPYAYFYTLTARSLANKSLDIKLSITYPDRDSIDDDELIAEGYTRDDDFMWSGQLPKAWLQTVTELVNKTKLDLFSEEELDEDDDYWEISVEPDNGSLRRGRPKNADSWQYLMQELIQASYEAIERERPFELTYLDLTNRQSETEIRLIASFVERTVKIVTSQNRRESTKTLPWTTLQHVMAEVYNHDYEPDEAETKRPRRDGQWLNLGDEEWYDVGEFTSLTKMLRTL